MSPTKVVSEEMRSPPLRNTVMAARRQLVGRKVRGKAPNAPLRKTRRRFRDEGGKLLDRFIERVVEFNRQAFPKVVRRIMVNMLVNSYDVIQCVGLDALSTEIGLVCHEDLRVMTTQSIEGARKEIMQYLCGAVQTEGRELVARIKSSFGIGEDTVWDEDSDEEEVVGEGEYNTVEEEESPDPFAENIRCEGPAVYTEVCDPQYSEISGCDQETGVRIVVPWDGRSAHVAYGVTPTGNVRRPRRCTTPSPNSMETRPPSSTETSPSLLGSLPRFSLSPALNLSGRVKRQSPESPIGSDRGVPPPSTVIGVLRGATGRDMPRKNACSIAQGGDGFVLDRVGNDVASNTLPGGSVTQ